ncbi:MULTISPECIES: WXG100 family type VII secretion target [Streptomyces]|uniref:WXG100 family type VII secretion target n=2 Tax=Streptomyces TaxID=1883 RepID=A0ABV9J8H5_9ACTN
MSTPAPRTTTTDHGFDVANSSIDTAITGCTSVATVVGQAQSILTAGWTGEASAVFDKAVSQWMERHTRLTNSMKEMQQVLVQNRHGMTTVESGAVQTSAALGQQVNF